MAGGAGSNTALALGELRGLLAAFAWANNKCNHSCTFTVEELAAGGDVNEALASYFGDSASKVSAVPLGDWQVAIAEALHRWLFEFDDLVKPQAVCALTDERCGQEMVDTILDSFRVGLE